MPLHTWADGDRLLAADLNGSFAWSQDQRLPGVFSGVAATVTVDVAAVENLRFLAPVAADDPLGYFRSSDGAFVIPTGLGGLYMCVVSVAATGTKGDQFRITLKGFGTTAWGGLVKNGGGMGMGAHASALGMLTAGTAVYVEASTADSSATGVNVRSAALVRLGRGIGAIGG